MHEALGDTFGLHKLGMLVNVLLSAMVLLIFFTRMAAAWRESEREVARLREQFARHEGILALAVHAASVAHELNTPLGTLTLMVDDLLRDGGTAAQREDYAAMKGLLEVCRDRVRELAAPAEAGEHAARVDLERVIDRWQLLRPTIDLRRSGSIAGHEQAEPAVGYLLQALLSNAADASQLAGNTRVDLELRSDEAGLHGEIRDYGVGFDQAQPLLPARLFRTSKREGMGIGLALSHATIERLGGELSMEATESTGVRIRFHVPATVKS
jgi:two-component system sensor histidine kinase RegB